MSDEQETYTRRTTMKLTETTKNLTTTQLKSAAISLYGTTKREEYDAYRLAITLLEERLSEDEFNFFLDTIERGRFGLAGGE